MESTKFAWLAGMIDGEAYVGMPSNGKKAPRVPVIEIKMTCRATVEECRRVAGRGYVSKWKSVHKQQYRWRCKGAGALVVSAMVLQYSVTKREALMSILSFK